MIRRWSRVINVNTNLTVRKKYHFKYFYVSFKKSIIFKKFRFKNTKFIRRSLIKAKHKGNWSIYLQIFKHWVFDFKFSKTIVKYQLYNEIFLLNFLTYDFCHLDYKKFSNFEINFFLSTHLTKRIYRFFKPFNYYWDPSHLPTNLISLPSPSKLILFENENANIIPIFLNTNCLWYSFHDNSKLDFDQLFFDLNYFFKNYENLIYNELLEIYKLLTLIWFNFVLNVK